jgi:DNA-binding beta-propeller fold protein YncE
VADSYNDARVVKMAKDGTWLKTVGSYSSDQDQFITVHSIAVDAQQGLVYVADRSNFRIRVYDTDLNFKKTLIGFGAPRSIQLTTKCIYSGDGTGKLYRLDRNTGELLGWAETGMGYCQTTCIIHSLHAESDNVVYRGSCS